MSLIVQKYGGTSVKDIGRIKHVARLVAERRKTCDRLVVVLSAMAGETNKLVEMAHDACDDPNEREMDMLLSSGERITVPLLAMALDALGIRAVSLTGRQSGIFTDGMHTKARIRNIEKEKIEKWLDKGYIAVVAGFQGFSEEGDAVTTLGRGGSDTTAVAIAAALKADLCEIYTDVDGVYTTDPSVEPKARRIDKITYEEMLEMASMGAKVLQVRSVEFAAKYRMPILVKSSFAGGPGTLVVSEDESMEEVLVSAVVFDKNQAKVTVTGIPDRPGIAAKIFEAVAEQEINVDMIIQNVGTQSLTDLSLTVPETESKKALAQLQKAAREVGAQKVLLDIDIGKVSVIGVGMRSHTGVAAKMFSILAVDGINIQMISTSEIKVSCVVKKEEVTAPCVSCTKGSVWRSAPMAEKVFLYDSTLRDGSQGEEVSFTLEDKLRIAEKLDDLGVHYIEGGWPGSNPKDAAFFTEVRKLTLKSIRVAAFGSTHHPSKTPAKDPNIKLLLDSKAPVVTIVGKTWDVHVRDVLRVTKPTNLKLIGGSVKYLKPKVDEVVFDAEHFFDGYKNDPAYALECLRAAQDAGADWLVLCDTNGGSLPHEVFDIVGRVRKELKGKIGIHCHNDGDLATANTIMAVNAGARQVQGTINGLGERCGNADLCAIIPNLQLKLGYRCLAAKCLKKLREASLFVTEMANLKPRPHQAYVGKSAFAHKGGLHVNAVLKNRTTYEHIDPQLVGNTQRILISDLSGKSSVLTKAEEYGVDLASDDPVARQILDRIKTLESEGFQFEGADGSLEILMKKAKGSWKKFFDVLRCHVIVSISSEQQTQFNEAVVLIKTPDGSVHHAVAEGNGPVNALDKAFRQALTGYYPELKDIQLLDFKVRILDEKVGTRAKTRVLIESGDEEGNKWGTVGVSENVIEASWQALIDSIDYRLHKKPPRKR